MSRYIEMKNSPPIMGNDEEAMENAECECWHGEEIHCGDGLAVIAQKRRPSLCRFGVTRRFAHPAKDGSFGDVEAKHFQLAVNARCAPGRVLGDHAKDNFAQFPANALPSRTDPMPRTPSPVVLEPGTMPADDRFGLNDDERLLPARPESAKGDPKQPIRHCHARPRTPMCQHGKLLAQGQILKNQTSAGSEEARG